MMRLLLAICFIMIAAVYPLRGQDASPSYKVKSIDSLYQKANYQYMSGHFKEALEAYSAIIAKVPDSFKAWHFRGGAYLALGDYDKADSDYAMAQKLSKSPLKSLQESLKARDKEKQPSGSGKAKSN